MSEWCMCCPTHQDNPVQPQRASGFVIIGENDRPAYRMYLRAECNRARLGLQPRDYARLGASRTEGGS